MTNVLNKIRTIQGKLNVLNQMTRKKANPVANVKKNNSANNWNSNSPLAPSANLLANNNTRKLSEKLKNLTNVTDDYAAAPGWKIYKNTKGNILSLEPGTNHLMNGYPSSRSTNNANLKEGWKTWTSIESDGDHKTFYYNPNTNSSTYNKPTKTNTTSANEQKPGNIALEGKVGGDFISQLATAVTESIKSADPSVSDLIFDINNKSHKQLVNYLKALNPDTPFKLYKPTKETDGYWNAAPGSNLYKLFKTQPSKRSSYKGKVWVLDPTPSTKFTDLRFIAVPSGDKTYITYSMYALPQAQAQATQSQAQATQSQPQMAGGIPSSQTTYQFGLEVPAKGGKRKIRRQSRK